MRFLSKIGYLKFKEWHQKVELSKVKYFNLKPGILAAIVDGKGKEGLVLDYHQKFDDELKRWLKSLFSKIPIR